VNFTPTSIAEESLAAGVVGVALAGQTVHARQVQVAGLTAFEAVEAGPVPAELVAATAKVYVVPLLSPATVADVGAGLPVTVVAGCAVVPT
jgi:hypothetical protein